MAQEINDGSAYLRALKQSTGAAARAPARDPNYPDPDANFQGAEKRRSPRYQCEGSAELREEGCDVRTWSTFTDISLHGCYVEAQATYPAATLVHMKLEVNGVRVETKGRVRISYPYLGMGIAFEDLSQDNAAHLKQMLATLSRPSIIMGPGVSSPHPSSGPMDGLPAITQPDAAIGAVIEYFQVHQLLMRDEFLKLVKKSQK